ncbi:esterase/lipase family protein [Stutzerimonas kirkiae]|uniref:esterase/lipase family protein n=1 Tax=Stutzerimonas kirkiae TaxID=2211392 RepID=UPI0010384D8F|nr:alpha/beta fold hydrolase [Stutzerimonas kirkiae]TBV11835.1 alpha/beta hydrolase [Stutzerimonas kirkiae]
MLALLSSGCAGVKVSSLSTSDYMAQRRGDVLTTGTLSSATISSLQVVGIADFRCREREDVPSCREVLGSTRDGLRAERRLSALAELWLQRALRLERQGGAQADDILDAYMETARHAYAYLFFSEREPGQRAFEDRQTQVRDYYNFAVQQAVTRLFERYRGRPPVLREDGMFRVEAGRWAAYGDMADVRLADGRDLPRELIPASSLSFAGLRNQYRRDGFGAELVAVTARRVVGKDSGAVPYSETPFPAITAVMSFPGNSLEAVLQTHEARLMGYDPYRQDSILLAGREVPLAANFTSGYGLWLARSGFAVQSLLTLVGRGEPLEEPRVYLMQPYDPDRRVIIMLHGLASSPEAWINVANEVLGDETLRQNYQIWQVYYPTNAPLVFNNASIRKAVTETLRHFDPGASALASRDVVLIGHSMGGVLSRLMVSSSGDLLWRDFEESYKLKGARLQRARQTLDDYLSFEPLPQVSRAIFVAAPHRGTPFAKNRLSRWAAGMVRLPVSVLGRFKDVAQLVVDPGSAPPASLLRPLNSIDNLSDQDPFVRRAAQMPISPAVRYHSIMGNDTPKLALLESSDGVVPYGSAHLPGAESEKVIASWHSVQETPEAILEIRRILHQSLAEDGHARDTPMPMQASN